MNTRISDAAVEVALNAYDRVVQSHAMSKDSNAMRAALEAALPHLQQRPAEMAEPVAYQCPRCCTSMEVDQAAKPEALRLRDELRERADFEDWYVQNAFDYVAVPNGSRDCALSWKAWQAALAATGKQQVGEAKRERDLLTEAIHKAAVKSGIYRADLEGMTGPQLLMACDDMAECIKAAQAVDLGQLPYGIRLIKIPARNSLDPIDVFVQDYELGRGRIVVTCYGQAWCGFWGAMGDRTVMQFVASCNADYVAGNMLSGRHEFTSDDERTYVVRIATEVINEFRALIDGKGK